MRTSIWMSAPLWNPHNVNKV